MKSIILSSICKMKLKGFSTIALLGILLTLALLVLKSEQQIISLLKLSSIHLSNLFSDENSEYNFSSELRFFCHKDSNNICLLNSTGSYRVYNYNKIFSDFSECPQSIPAIPDTFPDGVLLSNSSYQSSRSCTVWQNDRALRENIYINRATQVFSPEIISSGFIYFSADITVNQDSRIIAGGDIKIQSISSSKPVSIYLHSVSGSIQILSKSALVSIKELPADEIKLSHYIFTAS